MLRSPELNTFGMTNIIYRDLVCRANGGIYRFVIAMKTRSYYSIISIINQPSVYTLNCDGVRLPDQETCVLFTYQVRIGQSYGHRTAHYMSEQTFHSEVTANNAMIKKLQIQTIVLTSLAT